MNKYSEGENPNNLSINKDADRNSNKIQEYNKIIN